MGTMKRMSVGIVKVQGKGLNDMSESDQCMGRSGPLEYYCLCLVRWDGNEIRSRCKISRAFGRSTAWVGDIPATPRTCDVRRSVYDFKLCEDMVACTASN